ERLTSEIIEKDQDLQKWRKERDSLVKELEVKLGDLITSSKQKDEEIERLKASSRENLGE
ncbi:hypothetical protein chiPu_0024225, partial [Chiloscyllium punctatum]|nr:hypothetical protein [Chiloscyllium punctatum]